MRATGQAREQFAAYPLRFAGAEAGVARQEDGSLAGEGSIPRDGEDAGEQPVCLSRIVYRRGEAWHREPDQTVLDLFVDNRGRTGGALSRGV